MLSLGSFLDGAELLTRWIPCSQLLKQLGIGYFVAPVEAITDIHFERSMLRLLGLLTMHIDAGQA